jgi:N6-adenosine-specific RNA methylase IME4
MKFADIKALPVPGLAADNAVLWLWIVNPLMARGFELLEHWGFTYKGMVTWAKTQNDWVTPFVGCGYWLRGATEHMLLGVKGQVKPLVKVQPTWFSAPVTEHSEKPEHSYRVAERYWYEPRLEMFARRKRPGWSVWGNEVESDIVMPTGT